MMRLIYFYLIIAGLFVVSTSMFAQTAKNNRGGKSHVATSTTAIAMAYPSFSPSADSITVGSTVTWTNNDNSTHHTVTEVNGAWNSGDIAPGGTYSHTFNTTGTVNYQCTYHASMGMTGTLYVVNSNKLSVQSVNDTTCYNVPYQFSPNITGGASPLTYQWSPTTGLNSATAAKPVATISSTTTYTLTVTDANSNTASANITLVVLPKPTVTAAAGISLCQGATGTITGTATGGVPPLTYSWYPMTGVLSTNNATATVQPNATTTYWLIATGANGCNDSDSVVVKILNPPTLNVGNQTLCSGDTVQIGGVATGTGPFKYSWSPPDGLSSTNVAQPFAHPTKTTNYTEAVTDSNGCQISGQASVFVVQSPHPSITATAHTICEGDTAYLDSPDTNYTSYLWSTGETTERIGVSKTGRYSVTVTGQYGCMVTIFDSVTVLPTPPIPTITASGATVFCQGASVQLTAPQGSYTYLWSDGETTQAITAKQTGDYTVTLIGGNSCRAISQPFHVSVYPSAAIVGASEECANAQATYSVSDSASYQNAWVVSNGTIHSGQGSNSIVVQWGAAGSGAVSAIETTPLGCSDTVTMQVVVGSSLKPDIGVIGDTVLKSGDSVTLDAGAGYATYLWNTGATTEQITATTAGDYFVSVSDESGCRGTSDTIHVTTVSTGIKNQALTAVNAFSLVQNYPNPFSATTTIDFSLPESSPVTLKVYNALGDCVATLASGEFTAGLHSAEFDARGIPNGVYFYRLAAGKNVQTVMMEIVR